MPNSHQACSDRVKAIAAQQVQGQRSQQGQHLNTIALGVAVGVLTELGISRPVPLVFNRPALPHQPEQGFGAGAQGGEEVVNLLKRLAVAVAGAYELDDPAGASPALANGFRGIAGTQSPAHLAAMAGLERADVYWKVPVAAELSDDLLIQPALVVLLLRRSLRLDRQEQVGALLLGELKNAGEVCRASDWISTPSSSSVLSRALRAARSWDSPVS